MRNNEKRKNAIASNVTACAQMGHTFRHNGKTQICACNEMNFLHFNKRQLQVVSVTACCNMRAWSTVNPFPCTQNGRLKTVTFRRPLFLWQPNTSSVRCSLTADVFPHLPGPGRKDTSASISLSDIVHWGRWPACRGAMHSQCPVVRQLLAVRRSNHRIAVPIHNICWSLNICNVAAGAMFTFGMSTNWKCCHLQLLLPYLVKGLFSRWIRDATPSCVWQDTNWRWNEGLEWNAPYSCRNPHVLGGENHAFLFLFFFWCHPPKAGRSEVLWPFVSERRIQKQMCTFYVFMELRFWSGARPRSWKCDPGDRAISIVWQQTFAEKNII